MGQSSTRYLPPSCRHTKRRAHRLGCLLDADAGYIPAAAHIPSPFFDSAVEQKKPPAAFAAKDLNFRSQKILSLFSPSAARAASLMPTPTTPTCLVDLKPFRSRFDPPIRTDPSGRPSYKPSCQYRQARGRQASSR